MTTAKNLELTRAKQQIVRWNELSSVRVISPLVSQIHQSEPFIQIEDVLLLIIGTTHSKCLSLRLNIISTTHKFNGPFLFIMEGISHLRGRTVEGKPEGLNPHGKKKLFKFPEWMTYLSSVKLSVCQQLAMTGWGAQSGQWPELTAPRSGILLKREHSVPSASMSVLTGTVVPASRLLVWRPTARLCLRSSCWEDVLSHGMTHWHFSPCSLVSSD